MKDPNIYIRSSLFFTLLSVSSCFLLSQSLYPASPTDTIYIKQYLDKAKAFNNIECSDSSLYYVNKAQTLSSELEYSGYSYEIDQQFVNIFLNTGNYSIALDYAFEMMQFLEGLDKSEYNSEIKRRYTKLYVSIALIYFYLNKSNKSFYYLQEAEKLAEENYRIGEETDRNLCAIYNDIGAVYLQKGQFDIAQEKYKKALTYNKIDKDENSTAAIYNNLGIISLEQGNYNQALEYYKKSFSIRKRLNHKIGIGQVYNNLGRYYTIQQQYDTAIVLLNKGIALHREMNNYRSEIIAVRILSKIYNTKKDYKNEAIMSRRESELKDSLFMQENVQQIVQLEVQYEYDRLRRRDELDQQIVLAKKERAKLIFIMIASIFAFLSLVLILFYRNLKIKTRQDRLEADSLLLQRKNLELEKQNLVLQNTKLEQEIENKDKELTTHVMYLVQKNEFINSITDKLSELINANTKQISKQQMNTIIKQMTAHVDKTTWEEFEIRFQQIHQTFYINLNDKIPNLTPNEKRLCAFLYLNMTTKEISSITFQSIKSIEVARTRLRKKMQIDRDDNLISIIQTL